MSIGPFPGDGSNGPNVLTESGVVRRDITSSFGSASGRAEGAAGGYEESVSNLERVSLDSDMVFSDGYSLQMARMSGSNDAGWTATLNVPV